MTPAEYAQGLREFADFVEQHPELEPDLKDSLTVLVYELYDEQFIEKAQQLGLTAADVIEREDASTYFTLGRQFGPIALRLYARKENLGTVTTAIKPVEVSEWEMSDEVKAGIAAETVTA